MGFPDSSVGKESACNEGDPGSTGSGRSPWRRARLPAPVFLGFPCGSTGKESAYNVGDLDSIPGLGRSPGEGKGYHSSILAWRICRFAKSWTWLSSFHFLTHLIRESFPGGSADKESTCNVGDLGLILGLGKIPWRREQLPTPVF